jgi:acetyl-CoA C-acetyltransferase
MSEVVIVDAVRSPIGKKGGSLATAHPTDVLGAILLDLLKRNGLESDVVDQVIGGCINKVGAQAMNVTRTAWLAHGGDPSVACTTVDAQCGSSQYAVNLGAAQIASGTMDVVVAGGVENMSRIPIGADASAGTAAGMGKPVGRSYRERYEWASQFEAAERIAEKYGITRDDTDRFGLESQVRAQKAITDGRFDREIVSVEVDVLNDDGKRTGERRVVTSDEVPRDTSLELLGELKPVARPDGIHTAGTSSQLADGASATLLMSARKADEMGHRPLARVVATTLVGCDPVLMLEGPIPATQKLLTVAGLKMADIDVVEINEAFASVVLAWAKTIGADVAKTNPNGGAIALGHPLGATGSILVGKAVHELQRTGGRYGLIVMCCGGGLGTGTLIERL